MPLLDHFRPPLFPNHRWESFHSNWATRIADALTAQLPADFQVEEHVHAGANLEIDIATYEKSAAPMNGPTQTAVLPVTWAPPAPAKTMPAHFPDDIEVRIFSTLAGLTLVAAIELISPGNKDRPEERRAFACKCASYLQRGIALIVIDIVTSRRANLHNDTMRLMQAASDLDLPADTDLYAVAYRPVRRHDRDEINLWPAPIALGAPLPTLPLRLTGDLFVPVDFESSYQEACRRRRLG